MTKHQASRTLLKSPPELWAECSDAQSLARHLDDSFGEIRITRLEPEQTVAWEGERVSGTVRLEPSGWGTKVTLTAMRPASEVAFAAQKPEPAPEPRVPERMPDPPAPEPPAHKPTAIPAAITPAAAPEPVADADLRITFMGRVRQLFGGASRAPAPAPERQPFRPSPEPSPEPEAIAEPQPAPAPEPAPVPVVVATAPMAAPEPPGPGAEAALTAALESLGKAHHRPFSRG